MLNSSLISDLYLIKSEKVIKLKGIVGNINLSRSNTAVQIQRMYFGSGCRGVNGTWSYNINNNNINVSYAGSDDWANGGCLYTVCTDCTLIQSSVPSATSNWSASHSFVCSNLPDGLTINDLVIESCEMGIGSGQNDTFIYPSYSYNANTKTVTVNYSVNLRGNVQKINVWVKN